MENNSLFDRLGGKSGIRAIVEEVMLRWGDDPDAAAHDALRAVLRRRRYDEETIDDVLRLARSLREEEALPA